MVCLIASFEQQDVSVNLNFKYRVTKTTRKLGLDAESKFELRDWITLYDEI